MLYTTLRMLHILSGIMAVGGILYLWIVVYPVLKWGKVPAFSLRRVLSWYMGPYVGGSLIIILATGIWMTYMLGGNSFGSLLKTPWGWSIFISFLATLYILVTGFISAPAGRRMAKLARLTAGRTPTKEETQELNRLTKRFYRLMGTPTWYIVVVISLATMLILRYL